MSEENEQAGSPSPSLKKKSPVVAIIVLLFVAAAAVVIGVFLARRPKPGDRPVEQGNRYSFSYSRHPQFKNALRAVATDLMGGVPVEITGYGPGNESLILSAFEGAFNRMRELEAKLSTYRKDSEISKINAAAGKEDAVKVSPETFRAISKSLEYCSLFDGRLDITVKPFLDLWKEAAAEGEEPDESEIRVVRELVGFDMVELSENDFSVRLQYEGMSIDLGATAKGFLVDEAVTLLKSRGLTGFLVMAGGDGYASGVRPDGSKWRIGIADPRKGSQASSPEESSFVRMLEISDMAVTTSGSYERGYDIGGKHRSHIINPRTGKPCDSVPSVTAVAGDALFADAAATAFSVMADELGDDETVETAGYVEGVEILILKREGDKLTEHHTEGFKTYLP